MRGAGSRIDGGIGVPTMNRRNNLLSFLAIVDYYGFDFVNVRWNRGLDVLGRGGTAEVRELFITDKKRFAYKRNRALATIQPDDVLVNHKDLHGGRDSELAEKLFNEMVSEVTILGHPLIRHHQNIVGLAGIYWELSEKSDPWPVLVFDKANRGDMWAFGTSPMGLQMNLKDRLGICLDIAQAMTALHELGLFRTKLD